MKAQGFLEDLEGKPEALADLAADGDPWGQIEMPRRVVLLGMGSSRYAAGVAARRLRARGVDAWAEYASAATFHPGGTATLALGISASGATKETVDALAGYAACSTTVALTNAGSSPLGDVADTTVPLVAGTEVGGVACRTFQHTLARLRSLEAYVTGDAVPGLLERTREATQDLLDRRDAWLPPVADLLAEGSATFAIAPAERLSSAQQGALMFREGPRRTAAACESGDWLHVDIYLTKPLDYRALVFAGSRFDADIMGWMRERDARVVAVGGDLPGADLTVRYRHDDDEDVSLLTEVLVAELVAARWWFAQG